MTKLKILYIITKSGIGGAQKYVADLVENLDKDLFEVNVIYGGKDLKWLSNKVRPWFLFFNDFLAIFEMVKIFKKYNPDIIHLNSSKAGVLGSLAALLYNFKNKKDVKVVFTAHGWVFNPTNRSSTIIRWAYILLHQISGLLQDKIICVSECDYKLAKQYFIAPERKLFTIHNGINAEEIDFLEKKIARKELINKLKTKSYKTLPASGQVKDDTPWIGSVGRLVKEKNYETFIEAASLIPNAYFFIIGDGPELDNLQQTTNNLQLKNRVFFIEPTGEDYKYLKAFDIFVMSSIKEGLPYILLEAMAAELPIVVTEAGGMPEMIKNHENGLMVAQKNTKALAQAIKGMLTNKSIADELRKKARNVVQDKFGLEKMILKTENIYKENL